MTVFPFLPLLLLLLNSWILFLFTFVLPTFLPLVFIFLVDFIFWSFSLFWFQCWLGGKNQLSILFFGFLLFVFPLLALLLLVCRHLCFSSTSRCTLKLALFLPPGLPVVLRHAFLLFLFFLMSSDVLAFVYLALTSSSTRFSTAGSSAIFYYYFISTPFCFYLLRRFSIKVNGHSIDYMNKLHT